MSQATTQDTSELSDEEVSTIAVKMFRIANLILADEKLPEEYRKEIARKFGEAYKK